jgi:hypothetical protein
MLLVDPEGALAAIPSMLPVDIEARKKALELIKQVLSAHGELSAEDRERLERVSELFAVEEVPTPVRNRPVGPKLVKKEIQVKA